MGTLHPAAGGAAEPVAEPRAEPAAEPRAEQRGDRRRRRWTSGNAHWQETVVAGRVPPGAATGDRMI